MDNPAPDWHLKDWVAHFNKRQSSLTNELGWSKNRANKVWHSQQSYRREEVNEIAAWLGIAPYELLMPPEKAMGLRQLEETARRIAAEAPVFTEAAERGRSYEGPAKR